MSRRAQAQADLFKNSRSAAARPHRLEHGGDTQRTHGKRKLARPIDPKRPMHLVLKVAAGRGTLQSPRVVRRVYQLITAEASKRGVRVYQYANGGNHLHLVLKTRSRAGFQAFLRTITGLIARLMTGAKKGAPQGKFWDHLAFTRVGHWGAAYEVLKDYVIQNEIEAQGAWSRAWARSRRVERNESEGALATQPRGEPDIIEGEGRAAPPSPGRCGVRMANQAIQAD